MERNLPPTQNQRKRPREDQESHTSEEPTDQDHKEKQEKILRGTHRENETEKGNRPRMPKVIEWAKRQNCDCGKKATIGPEEIRYFCYSCSRQYMEDHEDSPRLRCTQSVCIICNTNIASYRKGPNEKIQYCRSCSVKNEIQVGKIRKGVFCIEKVKNQDLPIGPMNKVIDWKNRLKCDCGKYTSFGPNGEKKYFCGKCAREYMRQHVDAPSLQVCQKTRKCIICNKSQPTFGLPGKEKKEYCSRCAKQHGIEVELVEGVRKKRKWNGRKYCDCGLMASYGPEGNCSVFCKQCAERYMRENKDSPPMRCRKNNNNDFYTKLLWRANRKKIDVDQDENFKQLIEIMALKDCFYCGQASPAYDELLNSTQYRIDRIDSSKGYVNGNVVPCCSTCNFAKNALNVNEFLESVKDVNFYQKHKMCRRPNVCGKTSNTKLNANIMSYTKNGSSSLKRQTMDYLLTKEKIREFLLSSCNYCGIEKCNGIDRVDSNKGYVEDNCVGCCKRCNFMKYTMGQKQFLDWAIRVESNLNL